MADSPKDVTLLLLKISDGDRNAVDELIPLVYGELHNIASAYLHRERPNHTLQTTALVHETYLKLVDQRRVEWRNRAHFFAVSARLMRRVLVDHARARDAAKREGGRVQVTLTDVHAVSSLDLDVLALDEALARLEVKDPRSARIVELRYFGGLTTKETAAVLDTSTSTVEREWSAAKAWLYRELTGGKA
jgi:RNA polymerase sigma factor (TIGR02999 family)